MIPTTTLLESIYTCQGTKIKRQELSHHVNIPQLGVGVLAPLPRRRHHRHHVVRPQTEEFQIQKASPGRVQTAPGSPHRNGQRHHRHEEVGVRLPVQHMHLQEWNGRVGGAAAVLIHQEGDLAGPQVNRTPDVKIK